MGCTVLYRCYVPQSRAVSRVCHSITTQRHVTDVAPEHAVYALARCRTLQAGNMHHHAISRQRQVVAWPYRSVPRTCPVLSNIKQPVPYVFLASPGRQRWPAREHGDREHVISRQGNSSGVSMCGQGTLAVGNQHTHVAVRVEGETTSWHSDNKSQLECKRSLTAQAGCPSSNPARTYPNPHRPRTPTHIHTHE